MNDQAEPRPHRDGIVRADGSAPGALRAAQAHPQPRADERIDVLSGDRCCAGCGFNLYGQYIVREPHYGMLVVRCPECGLPAALQEYPALARSAGRLRAALAGAFLLLVLGGLALTGAAMYGMASVATAAVLRPYHQRTMQAWTNWAKTNLTQAQQTNWWANTSVMEKWWNDLPPDRFLRDFGGLGALNWSGLLMWWYAIAALVPIGMVWGVIMPRLRGLRMGALLLIPVAFGAALLLDDLGTLNRTWAWSPEQFSSRQTGWPPALLTLAACWGFAMVGASVGRRVARAFLRLVLPERLLVVFSFLWLVDGRELPRPARPVKPD